MTVPDFPSTNACFKTPHPQLTLNNNPPPPRLLFVYSVVSHGKDISGRRNMDPLKCLLKCLLRWLLQWRHKHTHTHTHTVRPLTRP